MNLKGTKKKNQVITANVFEQQEIIAKVKALKSSLKASTWHELETKGKFSKDHKADKSMVSGVGTYKATGTGYSTNARDERRDSK